MHIIFQQLANNVIFISFNGCTEYTSDFNWNLNILITTTPKLSMTNMPIQIIVQEQTNTGVLIITVLSILDQYKSPDSQKGQVTVKWEHVDVSNE